MIPDDRNKPAAIVRSTSSVRVLKQEVVALNKRIVAADRSQLIEHRELGDRLRKLKADTKHGEWETLLAELGVPSQRASEATTISAFWDRVPEHGSVDAFLKAKRANLYLAQEEPKDLPQDPKSPESGDLENANGSPTETCESESSSAGGPDPTGDAAEDVPTTALTDVDGLVLPEKARPAWECTAIERFIETRLRPLYDHFGELKDKPGTVHTDLKALRTKLHALANMLRSSKPAHRCRHCNGAGCKVCKAIGVVSKAIWSEENKLKRAKEWADKKRRSSGPLPE
jgi:hypothetical protein